MRVQQLNGRQVGHQGAGRIDQLAEPLGGGPDVRVEINRLVRISPPRQPVAGMGHPPGFAPSSLGDGPEPGIVRPGQVNLDIPHPPRQESPPLAPGKSRYALMLVRILESSGPAKEIEIEPRPGIDTGKHPLPALQHPVQLVGRSSVEDYGRESAHTHQLARACQAGAAVLEPPPIGQLLGQRARRFVVQNFVGDIHWMSRYQGESTHFPGS